MASHTVKRIQTDISQVMKNDPTGQIFGLIPMSDDMTDLTGFIAGPPDSPYAGGKFKFEMKIPANFPFAPPSVRFTTRVWHPNISSATGAICLSVLKNDWTAAYTLYNVLIAIQSMLTEYVPDDPQDMVVARTLLEDKATFEEIAAFWTYYFAMNESEKNELDRKNRFAKFNAEIDNVKKIFSHHTRTHIVVALSNASFNADVAVNHLE